MNVFLILFLLFVVLILWKCTKLSIYRHNYSQLIPCRPVNFFNPIGDGAYLLSLDEETLHKKFFFRIEERYHEFKDKPLFVSWIGYSPFLFVHKAEAAQELLKGVKNLEKSWVYEFFVPFFGTGLLTSGGEKWKSRRKLLSHCFHNDILKDFQSVFNENCQKLADLFQGETDREFTVIDNIIKLSSLDMICETMFGVSVGALENEESKYSKAGLVFSEIFMARIFRCWLWPDFLFRWSKLGRDFYHHVKIFQDFTKSVLKDKKAEYFKKKEINGKRKRKTLMDMLLERHMEFQDMSEEDIREEVDTFIMEGHETIAHAVVWTLYLIGLYPEVQAKIHEELDRELGKDSEMPLSMEDLNKLAYMECVIKETNRIYTIIPIYGRQILEDTEICGYTVPKGTSCLVLNYFLHRDESVFPDPEKFDPDRFLPENAAKIPDCGFLPFSVGPRNCIGKVFAMLEMKTILTYTLRRFTLRSLDGRDKVLPLMHITLNNSIPVRIRFRNRPTDNSQPV